MLKLHKIFLFYFPHLKQSKLVLKKLMLPKLFRRGGGGAITDRRYELVVIGAGTRTQVAGVQFSVSSNHPRLDFGSMTEGLR